LIASRIIKEYARKRKKDIETDFSTEEIRLSRNESIAISIELVGYQINNELSLQRYKRSVEALRTEMRLGNNVCFMRNKNQLMNWNALTYEGNTPFEPAFVIGIADID
jgi:hypothetical protein